MQVNIPMLRGKIAESGMKKSYLASSIGIDNSTFYRKMKSNGGTFTVEQMQKLISLLKLSKEDAYAIFFIENYQKCEKRSDEE